MNNTLTALKGVKVGHATHLDKLTGCTLVLFDNPYPAAYKTYGGAPGTFNTDTLQNGKSFNQMHGLFIAGGSLTGLMSASSIMQALVEKGIGWKDGKMINPSIAGAIVYDLGTQIGQYDPSYGKEAFMNASSDPVENGNVGAGTGTSVGKFQYVEKGTKMAAMKAGVGSSRINLENGITICALSVVNALGNIINPDGSVLAGNRDEEKLFKDFEDTTSFVTSTTNTTISIVGINVDLHTRENYERIAHFGSQGQVRAIHPVHTSIDGDTVFVFSTEEIKNPLNAVGKYFQTSDWPLFTVDIIGNVVSKAVQESIYDACKKAESISFDMAYRETIPSCNDFIQ